MSRTARATRMIASWAAIAGVASGSAEAATQGTIGATSTGSVTITATVPARAQITALSDVTFTNQDPSAAASNAQNVCVWSNTATKNYTITATGNGTANAFTLASGSLAAAPYSVAGAGRTGQTSGTARTAGSTATSPTCASGPATTASLVVGITAANLQAMQAAATYTGILTLVVTPQ